MDAPAADGPRAIVVADGDVPLRSALDAAWPGWHDGATIVIAADGGARGAERLGLSIDLIVGDGDSLGEADTLRFESAGVMVRRAPTAKDESDTELAIASAVELGAAGITVLGAFGGGGSITPSRTSACSACRLSAVGRACSSMSGHGSRC